MNYHRLFYQIDINDFSVFFAQNGNNYKSWLMKIQFDAEILLQ